MTPQVGHWFIDSWREWLRGLSLRFWPSLVFFTEMIVKFGGSILGLVVDVSANLVAMFITFYIVLDFIG
jgi:hypothetical protein